MAPAESAHGLCGKLPVTYVRIHSRESSIFRRLRLESCKLNIEDYICEEDGCFTVNTYSQTAFLVTLFSMVTNYEYRTQQ